MIDMLKRKIYWTKRRHRMIQIQRMMRPRANGVKILESQRAEEAALDALGSLYICYSGASSQLFVEIFLFLMY